MKKRVFLLIAMIVLVLTVSVQALETRTINNKPNLSFSGMTAYCSTVCTGEGGSDQVDATLTLYQGSNYIDSWSGSGNEYSARDCAPQPLKLSIHSGGIEHPCRCR